MRHSSPDAAGPCHGGKVVESRGVEPLADRPSETGAIDPLLAGAETSQAPRQDAPLPRVTDDLLNEVEDECLREMACRWSAIKLAMVGRIRLQNAMLDAMLPKLEQRIARLESRFNFRDHLARQAAWSERTFGPGTRTEGILDHIKKEMEEVRRASVDYSRTMLGDNPEALKEWIDIVILGLDGAWRSGATPDQIIEALAAKQAKNEARTWPDWRTADPSKAIEHDRSGDE